MNEHDSEPVPGLPEKLPPGEHILWQGAPTWRSLARRVFHVRKLAAYCVLLMSWRLVADLSDGATMADAAVSVLWLLPLLPAALGLPALLAWLYSRTTLYTITNRRVVIRYGVALPMSLNIPFKIIDSAALRQYGDGTGDIPIALSGPDRIAYLHLWPHARPWRLARTEPMLRGVPDAAQVAEILGRALVSTAPRAQDQPKTADAPQRTLVSAAA